MIFSLSNLSPSLFYLSRFCISSDVGIEMETVGVQNEVYADSQDEMLNFNINKHGKQYYG